MAKIVLDIDGPRVTVDRFMKAVESMVTVVSEVDKELSGDRHGTVRWIVSKLSAGSAHLEATAEPRTKDITPSVIDRIVKTAAGGLLALEQNENGRPRHFSDTALEAAKTLTRTLQKGSISRVQVTFNRKRVEVTQRTAAAVDRLIGEKFKSLGSVEGLLEVISIHGRPHFRVYDRITSRAVDCYFTGNIENIWRAFGKRVSVYGVVRSRQTGEPVSIEVRGLEDITIFPPDDELPRPSDIRGILG